MGRGASSDNRRRLPSDDGDNKTMEDSNTNRKRNHHRHKNRKERKEEEERQEEKELRRLQRRIRKEAPKRGHIPPLNSKAFFSSLPLSQRTLLGLEGRGDENRRGKKFRGRRGASLRKRRRDEEGAAEEAEEGGGGKFVVMTDIQHACIPHALAGRDILGAAKTGSGKTLAFLVPLVENLYRARWSPSDGPGALILSPTRELAMQIFDVLRLIGSHHHLSAGLLVGGSPLDFTQEQARVVRTNILVATPGRVLQHMEQTPYFDVSQIKVLVLDEADRILDMGFRDQLKRIVDYLPPSRKKESLDGEEGRQTLLFSATQTRNVKDLARLSLYKPEYLGVHDKSSHATPQDLQQSLMECPLPHKLDLLFSFLKSHPKSKTLVFFSTCSIVRYVHDVFRALQLGGIFVAALHGKIAQEKRSMIFRSFAERPEGLGAVMLATDLASRGLDFPKVDWVVQADAPEDRETYIHRVGRTARYHAGGRSLLVVLPSEREGVEKMLAGKPRKEKEKVKDDNMDDKDKDEKDEEKKESKPPQNKGAIPFKVLSMNPDKAISITSRVASLVASHPTLQRLAKKAFCSYVRCIAMMPNKATFDVNALPLEEYATSLGLSSTPSTKFLKQLKTREEVRGKKNCNHKLERLKAQIKAEKLKKKIAALGGAEREEGRGEEGKTVHGQQLGGGSDEEEDEEDLLRVKRTHKAAGGNAKNDDDSDDDDDEDSEQESDEDSKTPTSTLDTQTERKSTKRIRLESGSNGLNTRIVFNEDGKARPSLLSPSTNMDKVNDKETLQEDRKAYLARVQQRLAATEEEDHLNEKARIRALHKKRRMELKVAKMEDAGMEEDDEGGVTLIPFNEEGESQDEDGTGTRSSGSDDESSSDSDDDSSSSSSGSGSSSESEEFEDDESEDDVGNAKLNLKDQEDLALALLRGGS